MIKFTYYFIIFLLSIAQTVFSQTKQVVAPFDKVIISPYIQTTFIEGNEESVIIEDSRVSEDKINIEVKNNTLRVYLDDAKEITKNKTIIKNGIKRKVPIYKGKTLTITVTYKKLNELSLRGEEAILCKSKMVSDDFTLSIYGESEVVFNDVQYKNFNASLYGESTLTIKDGTIETQKITAYGESIINLIAVQNETSRLKAFGESKFIVQSSELIKLTAFGEATLEYRGSAAIKRGLNIGDVTIARIE